jgi:hypothetical protein
MEPYSLPRRAKSMKWKTILAGPRRARVLHSTSNGKEIMPSVFDLWRFPGRGNDSFASATLRNLMNLRLPG